MSADHIDVKIMGRDYRIACLAEDQDQLLKVVALVDDKMTQIASKTKNMIPERIAVMAAMSIAQSRPLVLWHYLRREMPKPPWGEIHLTVNKYLKRPLLA
jgi:hypothetical protein